MLLPVLALQIDICDPNISLILHAPFRLSRKPASAHLGLNVVMENSTDKESQSIASISQVEANDLLNPWNGRVAPDPASVGQANFLTERPAKGLVKKEKEGKNAHPNIHSIHGEQAARRRAIAELIFFAGVNDLRRCKQIVSVWNIKVRDPNVMDYDKRTPLHIAAAEGAYSVVAWLVNDESVDVNPLDRHFKTPTEEAARNDHYEVVKLLTEKHGCVWEDDKLVTLEQSKIKGIVNTRRMAMDELGWDPEWEVNPRELKLLEKIGSGEFGDVFKAKWHGSFVSLQMIRLCSSLPLLYLVDQKRHTCRQRCACELCQDRLPSVRHELLPVFANCLPCCGHQVAAKLLKRSDEIALGDFRTEIAILRKIHHPNTTQFLGACTKQKPYIVLTELMACSLADAFQRTYFVPAPRRQVEVALDFARGMAYLHSRRQPIVHRDLKPANLMISGNLNADTERLFLDSGVVKVADFGLSKSLVPVEKHGQLSMTEEDATTYKMTGETGSYRYMAPEVFRHEPYNLKVDVYSFAMIAFQIFECVAPFAGDDPLEAAKAAAMENARPAFPPRRQLSPIQEGLRTLVKNCWEGEPEKRPSFEDIVQRLEAMLETLPKHTHFDKGPAPGDCCVVS
ncbi:hypothetical protein QJQ45_027961 [Haematococcus lacustris]|nr:hypothetical protein QJQ45_027961 [Haematococcus lacustris]